MILSNPTLPLVSLVLLVGSLTSSQVSAAGLERTPYQLRCTFGGPAVTSTPYSSLDVEDEEITLSVQLYSEPANRPGSNRALISYTAMDGLALGWGDHAMSIDVKAEWTGDAYALAPEAKDITVSIHASLGTRVPFRAEGKALQKLNLDGAILQALGAPEAQDLEIFCRIRKNL